MKKKKTAASPSCKQQSIFAKDRATISRTIPEGVSLLDGPAANMVNITGVAAEAWKLLDGKRTVEAIVLALSEKHRIEPTLLHKLTSKVIVQLAKRGFIKKVK